MNTRTTEADSHHPTTQTRAPTEPLPVAAGREKTDSESQDVETAALEKVRELLFGEQVRETGDRIRELEERLFDDTRRIHREITERVENLGRDLYARLDQLGHKLATLEGTSQENNQKTLEQIGTLRDEIAERLAESTRALDARITENHEEAIARAEQSSDTLEEAKMDREALASLLSEMASRVRSD